MQETRRQHEDSHLVTPLDTACSQGGTAIHLSLSHLMAGAVAVGLSVWLAHQHVPPFPALLVALAAAAICGFLCTLTLQYSLYLLELTLSRLAHESFHSTRDESNEAPSFTRRFPLGPLFLRAHEIEQRVRRYRTNERLTADVREQALQQAREAAALAERNRIARELHDSIKQHIFGINASAAAARAYWQRENMEGAREAVGDIERSAQGAQVEMQALLQQLRPAPLENTSLLEALHTQAQALSLRTGGRVEVDLAALPEQDRLLPGTQEAIFRLVQEAFANIAKHARARTIWLTLGIAGQALHMTVRDDGQGFDLAHVCSGMGLSNLRERTRALQGNLEIRSQPGQGTTVLITIPLLEALRNPEEEARERYELARAEELARRGYQFCAKTSLLGVVLGMVGILNTLNPLFGLGVVAALLVAISGYARGVYYRVRVVASAGRDNRAVLELVPLHYRTGLGLMFSAILDLLYLIKLSSSLGVTAVRWLALAIPLCLFGLILVSLWGYAHETARTFHLCSTQELGKELAKRKQAFVRSLIILGMISTSGVIINHALYVFPPVTPAQQNASVMVLTLLVGGGMVIVWNYRSVQRLKEQLRQRTNDQSTLAQEEKDDGSSDSRGSRR
jgi:signal transduction histidine kinase